jgi:hypothetical protein
MKEINRNGDSIMLTCGLPLILFIARSDISTKDLNSDNFLSAEIRSLISISKKFFEGPRKY